jgi:hypothetical protein
MASTFEGGRLHESAEIVLLVSTHKRAAHFVPAIRTALARSWPNHPCLRFVTDGGAADDDVLQASTGIYVPLMLEALSAIRTQFPKATHVLHMLEDHCPLRLCDVARIEQTAKLCLSSALASVSFITYEWPWSAREFELVEYGNLYGLPRIDTVMMDGVRLGLIPMTFYRYFQVQPTVWRIDYLAKALTSASAEGIMDPWAFEQFKWDSVEQHYVSEYPWPTVHHGFLVKGSVNVSAFKFADRSTAKDLLRLMRADAEQSMGRIAFNLRRIKGALVTGLGR